VVQFADRDIAGDIAHVGLAYRACTGLFDAISKQRRLHTDKLGG